MFHRQNSAEEKNKTEQSVSVKKPNETAETQPAPTQQTQEKKEERVMPENQNNAASQQAESMNETSAPQGTPQGAPQENPMGLYQRQTSQPTPASRVGGYPGYGAAPQGNNKAVYGSSDKNASDRRLVIGPGITMSGEIESCDNLIVEGTVEASLKGASILDITETGVFYGSVEIEEAVIAGRFEGDITVNGRLTVTSSGSITGTIVYGELAIEAGASIDGRMSPLASAASTNADKPKQKVSVAPRNDNANATEAADHGEAELPFSGNNVAASR